MPCRGAVPRRAGNTSGPRRDEAAVCAKVFIERLIALSTEASSWTRRTAGGAHSIDQVDGFLRLVLVKYSKLVNCRIRCSGFTMGLNFTSGVDVQNEMRRAYWKT